jgi:hypothetical protein
LQKMQREKRKVSHRLNQASNTMDLEHKEERMDHLLATVGSR